MVSFKRGPVSLKRSGRRRASLLDKGFSDAEPREGEFHGDTSGAEPAGGGASLHVCWLLGLTLSAARGSLLASVVGCRGCCGLVTPYYNGGKMWFRCPDI